MVSSLGWAQNYHQIQSRNTDPVLSENCEGIFAYKQDQNGVFGLIRISNPDWSKNVLKVEFSVDAHLNVRLRLGLNFDECIKKP